MFDDSLWSDDLGSGIPEGEEEIVVDTPSRKRNYNHEEAAPPTFVEPAKPKKSKPITTRALTDADPVKLASDLVQVTRSGSFSKMQSLVEKGANVNEKVVGCTALMYAAFYGRDEMVSYLLENGASLDEQNLNGITALHWACEKNQYSTIELLLKAGANANLTDTTGFTALHKAAKAGNLKMVELLVELGNADVNKDASKTLPSFPVILHEAVINGHEEVVKFLLDHGANVDQINHEGRTALHRAVLKNHSAIAQCLVDYLADINIVDANKRTPLHWAAFFGFTECFKILVDNGADVSLRDKSSATAEDIAVSKGRDPILQWLAEWKQVNTTTATTTAAASTTT